MNTGEARPSAKIYQFPSRNHGKLGAQAAGAKVVEAGHGQANFQFGGAWYHDAAIQEDRSRKA